VVLHQGGNEGMGGPRVRGRLGAGSLAIHSVIDSMAIGLAFQVSTSVGVVVAIAVLVHDFSDGINTVNLVLKNSGTGREALRWLLVDAAAPLLGVLSTLLFTYRKASLVWCWHFSAVSFSISVRAISCPKATTATQRR
jgi:zinc transporter ZupT